MYGNERVSRCDQVNHDAFVNKDIDNRILSISFSSTLMQMQTRKSQKYVFVHQLSCIISYDNSST
jgi:hypothetical protein